MDSKRNVCDVSYPAEDKFAYVPNNNRKCGKTVNSSHIRVAHMEPFSYATLADQQIYVAASTPFSCSTSPPATDIEKLERKSSRCDEQENSVMTATEMSSRRSSQLLPFRKRHRSMFLTQCGGAEASVTPSQSLEDVVVELKQYAARAGKITSSVCTATSTNANYDEETRISFDYVDSGLQLSMSANNETESHELVLDESCVCDEQGVVLKTIKSSYNTYIATVMSGRVDCTRRASQNTSCHSHIITLVEHVMELNDALLFRTRMNQLKETCAILRGDDKQNKPAFPA